MEKRETSSRIFGPRRYSGNLGRLEAPGRVCVPKRESGPRRGCMYYICIFMHASCAYARHFLIK